MGESTVLPKSFPSPQFLSGVCGQGEAQLVGEHGDLPAMMRVVGDHVGEHCGACGPWFGPAVAMEDFDAALGKRERFGQHVGASLAAFEQGGAGLFLGACGVMERRG